MISDPMAAYFAAPTVSRIFAIVGRMLIWKPDQSEKIMLSDSGWFSIAALLMSAKPDRNGMGRNGVHPHSPRWWPDGDLLVRRPDRVVADPFQLAHPHDHAGPGGGGRVAGPDRGDGLAELHRLGQLGAEFEGTSRAGPLPWPPW